MNAQVSRTMDSNEEQLGSLSFMEYHSSNVEGDINIKSDVGVILPTYCEAVNIGQLIREIEGLKQKYPYLSSTIPVRMEQQTLCVLYKGNIITFCFW